MVSGINSTSFVSFTSNQGSCTNIGVTNGSAYMPDRPELRALVTGDPEYFGVAEAHYHQDSTVYVYCATNAISLRGAGVTKMTYRCAVNRPVWRFKEGRWITENQSNSAHWNNARTTWRAWTSTLHRAAWEGIQGMNTMSALKVTGSGSTENLDGEVGVKRVLPTAAPRREPLRPQFSGVIR